jgi:hypothetical protein
MPARSTQGPSGASAALGVSLFISAFAWPHESAQFTNTWIIAVLTVIVSLLTAAVPPARLVNTVLATWLFFSAWLLPTAHNATIWNNVIVASALIVLSLAGIETDGFIRGTAGPFRVER